MGRKPVDTQTREISQKQFEAEADFKLSPELMHK